MVSNFILIKFYPPQWLLGFSLSGLLLLNNRKYLSTIAENNGHADIQDKWNLRQKIELWDKAWEYLIL